MNMTRSVFRSAVIAIVTGIFAGCDHAAEGSAYAPPDWVGSKDVPVIQPRLTDAEYAAQCREVLRDPKSRWYFDERLPAFGGIVEEVTPGGLAEKSGLAENDFIVAIDHVWRGVRRIETQAATQAQTFSMFSLVRGKYDAVLAPGVSDYSYRDIAFWGGLYARTHGQDQPWHEAMRIACLGMQLHHLELAETALKKAEDAGFSAYPLKPILCRLLLREGRYADSITIGLDALKDPQCKEMESIVVTDVFLAAVTSGDFRLAEFLQRNFDSKLLEPPQDWVRQLATSPFANLKELETLCYANVQKLPKNLLQTLAPLSRSAQLALPALQKDAKISFNVQEAHYQDMIFDPNIREFYFSATCTFEPSDTGPSDFQRNVSIRILDKNRLQAASGDATKATIGVMTLFTNGEIDISSYWWNSILCLYDQSIRGKPFKLEIIGAPNSIHLYMNKRCLLTVPMQPTPLALEIIVVGAKGSIENVVVTGDER